jgi:hypothetical protein
LLSALPPEVVVGRAKRRGGQALSARRAGRVFLGLATSNLKLDEVAERLRAAVCQGYEELQNGLKSMISGPFFIGTLVGYRRMALGRRLGTLSPMVCELPIAYHLIARPGPAGTRKA